MGSDNQVIIVCCVVLRVFEEIQWVKMPSLNNNAQPIQMMLRRIVDDCCEITQQVKSHNPQKNIQKNFSYYYDDTGGFCCNQNCLDSDQIINLRLLKNLKRGYIADQAKIQYRRSQYQNFDVLVQLGNMESKRIGRMLVNMTKL